MGYYSDVKIACTKGVAEKIFEVSKDIDWNFEIFKSKNGNYIFVWDYIRWWNGFDAVNKIEAILKDTCDLEDEGWYIIRIGENITDIDEEHSDHADDLELFDLIWINREIVCNYDCDQFKVDQRA